MHLVVERVLLEIAPGHLNESDSDYETYLVRKVVKTICGDVVLSLQVLLDYLLTHLQELLMLVLLL